jgi:hypothetical protein
MLRYFLIFITFLSFFLCPTTGFSDILVDDMLVLKGEETLLSAETRGRVFTQGGRLVEFFLNGKSLGRSLSGGDGFAYKQFTPLKSGLFKISVKSGDDENTGLLLSLKKGDKVIFVDIEGSLFEGIFSQKPRQGSQEIIKGLSRKFPVVFLQTGLLSIKVLKSLLKESGFVDLPVLAWGEGELFDEINKKGLKIKAIIGCYSVISSAQEYKPQSFSFEEAEDAVIVKNWEEIGEMLLKGKKPSH